MSYLKYNGQMIVDGGKYVVRSPLPVVAGVIEFLSGGGEVLFDSEPDVLGSKTINLNVYLDTSTSSFDFSSKTASNADFLLITYNDPPDWAGTDYVLAVHTRNATGGGNVRQFYDISSYIGEITTIQVVKTAGLITSVTVGGDVLAKVGDGYFDIGASSLKTLSGASCSIWDVEVVGAHNWVGYPDGDQDSAWVDTVGSNDGVVGGSVSTRDLF